MVLKNIKEKTRTSNLQIFTVKTNQKASLLLHMVEWIGSQGPPAAASWAPIITAGAEINPGHVFFSSTQQNVKQK